MVDGDLGDWEEHIPIPPSDRGCAVSAADAVQEYNASEATFSHFSENLQILLYKIKTQNFWQLVKKNFLKHRVIWNNMLQIWFDLLVTSG